MILQAELDIRLSNEAVIFGPENPLFSESTSRWNTLFAPTIQMVVVIANERDIQSTILFCNEKKIPFLAVNRGHGNAQSLGSFTGIQIHLAKLQDISINADKKTAWFAGGVSAGNVTRYLWREGFVTTTGSCDCVGLLGVGLGGGHGRHEGLYGMISDNIVRLKVVLANGEAVLVDKSNHPDLFWAMRGAGHNFGIVTSLELRIWPRGPDTWHYHNYIWRGSDLERVFTALNDLHNNGTTPVNMAFNFGSFVFRPEIDTKQPVIVWSFAYRGSADAASQYLAPFNAIPSIGQQSGNVPYPEISKAQSTDDSSAICQHGKHRVTTTIGLQNYNLTSERYIFDDFAQKIKNKATIAAGAAIIHEGYSTRSVQDGQPDASAYPFRQDYHLMLMQVTFQSQEDALVIEARAWTDRVRQWWHEGQPHRPMHAYVNYANGFEPLEEIYGSESWRLEKLRQLKQLYDPRNSFRYYNPIIPTH
ncbi:hypothetical protein Micbo1qcDRAFT_128479 [Microdochium bolleyi]|uniref:FAD-binding PCMH-type domain-containing protein n=1 Tax=Microdochium bolleyi TaxID=196109 RepID=A0A136IJN0_9PEZI|nr:hypothetical protein Micbo1qcDRAFT_128479 [Microdochium bolleyi]